MMEYQFTRGIQRPNAARLSLALSPVLQGSLVTGARREIARGEVFKGSPLVSSHLTIPLMTPYSALSSGSMYSQESWNASEAPPFHKPLLSSRLAARSPIMAASPPATPESPTPNTSPAPRESPISHNTGGSHSPESRQSPLEPNRASSATSPVDYNSTISLRDVDVGSAGKKREKRAKLREMYKRASKSTKALTKVFSRSPPGPGGSSPPRGVSKRPSLKSSISTPPYHDSNIDPFASGNSVSSYGLSPLTTEPPSSLKHVRMTSLPDTRPQSSVDGRSGLYKSPSLSSPLGVPNSTSLTKATHIPFPVNSSTVPLPPRQRSRSVSQSSVTSTTTQTNVYKSSQHHDRPPMPPVPPSTFLCAQSRRSPPTQPPEGPQPDPPLPRPLPKAFPASAGPSSPGALSHQRSRSRSVGEVVRPAVVPQDGPGTEALSHQAGHDDIPWNPNPRGEEDTIDDFKKSSLGLMSRSPPTVRSRIDSKDANASGANGAPKLKLTLTRDVRVVVPAPSLPSARATFQESPFPPKPENANRWKPRAGRAHGRQASASDQSDPQKARKLPVPTSAALPHSGLASARDSLSLRRPLPEPPTHATPFLPQSVIQNVPRSETHENQPRVGTPNKSSLRSQPSIQAPRFASLPSMRSIVADAPPLPAAGSTSQYEGPRGHSHFRSPSLPNTPAKAILPPGSAAQGRSMTRQPLPSSIAERLRSRDHSSSMSDVRNRRPSLKVDTSSPVKPPSVVPAREKKEPALESIPSASTYGFTGSPNNPSGSTTSITSTSLQTPPSPTIPTLLELRTGGRPRASRLKSPSVSDLRHVTADSTNPLPLEPVRRPNSPPSPLSSTQPHNTIPLPKSVSDSGTAVPTSIKHYPSSDGSLPLSTMFIRPRHLTRPKKYSYPPLARGTASTRAFHARSNKELAKDGGWDFLDTPPRPPRSPPAQMAPTLAASDSNTNIPGPRLRRDRDASPIQTIAQVADRNRERSTERSAVIGMAL